MIGFSFYSFEGIGVVMPIYENTKSTVNFKQTLISAIITLAVLFSFFGFICYRYFGHMDESKSFVIENLEPTVFI
jgi:amino acid permease